MPTDTRASTSSMTHRDQKGTRRPSTTFGDLGTPFIIAFGTYIHDRDRWHSANAMYGHVAAEIGEAPDGSTVTREVRQPDGYFGTPPDGPTATSLASPRESAHAILPAASGDDPTRHPNPAHGFPTWLGCRATFSLAGSTLARSQPGDGGPVDPPWPPRPAAARRA